MELNALVVSLENLLSDTGLSDDQTIKEMCKVLETHNTFQALHRVYNILDEWYNNDDEYEGVERGSGPDCLEPIRNILNELCTQGGNN